MRPGVERQVHVAVDLLFAGAGRDREPHAGAAAVVGQEHVVAGAGAEVEDARPGVVGRRIDPGRHGEVRQATDDPGGQVDVLAATVELDRVADLARYARPGRAACWDVADRRGLGVAAAVDQDRIADVHPGRASY